MVDVNPPDKKMLTRKTFGDHMSKTELFITDHHGSMVVWHVTSAPGAGHLASPGAPLETPSSGSGALLPAPGLTPETNTYMAICDHVFHPPEIVGARENGVWMGPFRDSLDNAHGDRDAHEDVGAYVVLYLYGRWVGPM